MPPNDIHSLEELSITEWSSLPRQSREAAISQELGGGLRLHLRIAERTSAKRLLLMMPAAQSRETEGQMNPLFSRWNWAPDYPETHVVTLSDPALYQSQKLSAAWFIAPDRDLLKEIAENIHRVAEALSIHRRSILVYGSSLGGFGALGLASLLPGAGAVAEIPQLDLRRWPIARAIRGLEEHAVHMPFDKYGEIHPEQVDVLARFRAAKSIPPFLIITNPQDTTYSDHLEFMRAVRSLDNDVTLEGPSRLLISDEVSGHRVLSRVAAAKLLGTELAATREDIWPFADEGVAAECGVGASVPG